MECAHANSVKHGYTPGGRLRRRCKACGIVFATEEYRNANDAESMMNSFVHGTAKWMRQRNLVEYEEAVGAGMMAFYQAASDGEIDLKGGIISRRAARYIRREMLRAAAYKPQLQQLEDIGYTDGRTLNRGPRCVPKSKQHKRAHKLMEMGLCKICGKPPAPDSVFCPVCREKRREQSRRYRERNNSRKAGAKRESIAEVRLRLGLQVEDT